MTRSASDPSEIALRRRSLSEELDRLLRKLREMQAVERVILFGSAATGEVREWSDLDLIVVMKTNEPFLDRLIHLRQELNPQVDLDLLVYTPEEFERLCRERSFFRDEMLAKGKVLYEKRR